MSGPARPDDGVVIRRATDDDHDAILTLAQRSLGWDPGPATEAHFRWKHVENPFGRSPAWVAEEDGRIAGFRTFLRWELLDPAGRVLRVVRAVDTATDPDFQGQGIFTRLTTTALAELAEEGVDFVFNTPNSQSRPGYLKMGWQVVGRLPVGIRPTGPRGLARVARARTPAERRPLPSGLGDPAPAVLGDVPASSAQPADVDGRRGLRTHRSARYLAWRYGPPALHYRVVVAPGGPEEGAVVFHLRRRGPAIEAVICEELAPPGSSSTLRALQTQISRSSGSDYLVRLRQGGEGWAAHRFLPVPAVGPVLTARSVTTDPPSALADWLLTMGDVELF